MDVVSYRGPGVAGGVSGVVSQAIEQYERDARWWSLTGYALIKREKHDLTNICQIMQPLVEGHYRYCNNFLWPIMHEMPQYTSFHPAERLQFHQFNLALAGNIQRDRNQSRKYFIHDYQLALLPGLLGTSSDDRCTLFWHIPWPRFIHQQHVQFIAEIVESVLTAYCIGFHTQTYATNFLDFIDCHMPNYCVDRVNNCVQKINVSGDMDKPLTCKIVVQPVGLNTDFWANQMSRSSVPLRKKIADSFARGSYVLSVDRADYTKGVFQRLQAINEFFARYPERRGELTFVQICQQTRAGLSHFDEYWHLCNKTVAEINDRWLLDGWYPIVWHDKPLDTACLAALYESARIMLVNPLRDGLNLTAKEFVACSGAIAGTLLLSPGAGVWSELGKHVLTICPNDRQQMVAAIAQALTVSDIERKQSMRQMRTTLDENSLQKWWFTFARDGASNVRARSGVLVPARIEEIAFAN